MPGTTILNMIHGEGCVDQCQPYKARSQASMLSQSLQQEGGTRQGGVGASWAEGAKSYVMVLLKFLCHGPNEMKQSSLGCRLTHRSRSRYPHHRCMHIYPDQSTGHIQLRNTFMSHCFSVAGQNTRSTDLAAFKHTGTSSCQPLDPAHTAA